MARFCILLPFSFRNQSHFFLLLIVTSSNIIGKAISREREKKSFFAPATETLFTHKATSGLVFIEERERPAQNHSSDRREFLVQVSTRALHPNGEPRRESPFNWDRHPRESDCCRRAGPGASMEAGFFLPFLSLHYFFPFLSALERVFTQVFQLLSDSERSGTCVERRSQIPELWKFVKRWLFE